MKIGYTRVSSKGQKDNNSFEQQEQEILAKYPDAVIYKEQFTGKTTKRPVLDKVIRMLGKDDMLVVTKLDRLARNAIEGYGLVKNLFERGVSVHVLNLGLLEDTPTGRFFLNVMLATSEMELSMIHERMAGGKEIARKNPDYREGRPPVYTTKQKEHALRLLEQHSPREVTQMTGISRTTLFRIKKEFGKQNRENT